MESICGVLSRRRFLGVTSELFWYREILEQRRVNEAYRAKERHSKAGKAVAVSDQCLYLQDEVEGVKPTGLERRVEAEFEVCICKRKWTFIIQSLSPRLRLSDSLQFSPHQCCIEFFPFYVLCQVVSLSLCNLRRHMFIEHLCLLDPHMHTVWCRIAQFRLWQH